MAHGRRVESIIIGTVAAIFSFASVEAIACGESLFRVGKGVAYRAQTAPLPGKLLVVAPNEDARGFADRLAAAGHDVQVVESASLLAGELSQGGYEIVLAPFTDREAVEAHTASAASNASYVPVTLEASEEALAKQMYERSVASSDSINAFLKVIHRTLKGRA